MGSKNVGGTMWLEQCTDVRSSFWEVRQQVDRREMHEVYRCEADVGSFYAQARALEEKGARENWVGNGEKREDACMTSHRMS